MTLRAAGRFTGTGALAAATLAASAKLAATAAVLAGPTALAFFTGGYFARAREWAGVGAWACAVLALLCARGRILPRSAGGRAALGGLAGLTGWTLLSILWAPIAGGAYGAGEIAALYLGGLVAAAHLLRDRRAQQAVEPIAALGTAVVIGYGISERLLPGLLHFTQSLSADGRLEQPLTYWNAMGELAAIGLVLCVRLAGSPRRPVALRCGASCVSALLGMGLYLTFSRGALFAAAAGLVSLVVLAPDRAQLWGGLTALAAAVLGAVAAAPFHTVTDFGAGGLGQRERQGAIVLALLVVIAVTAALVAARVARLQARPLRLPRHSGRLALVLVCGGFALAVAFGAHERSGVALGGGAGRLGTLQSNRYDYWSVALKAFRHDPLRGVGAGGWSVYWLRDRPYPDGATDAHSLELQTLAELGLVGIALLAAFLIGIALAGRVAMRRVPAQAAGPLAGCIVWLAHSPLDWDWQMPAVTLVAALLAGALLALADAPAGAQSASATRGASRRKTTTATAQIAT